jgi:hypothetical protein
MKFLEFTTGDQPADRVLVNPARIQRIISFDEQVTHIVFDRKDMIIVREPLAEVLRKLADRNDRGG